MYGFDKYDGEDDFALIQPPRKMAWFEKICLFVIMVVIVYALCASVAHATTLWYTDSTTNLGGSATFTGTARDTGTQPPPYTRFGCSVFTDQTGNLFVEDSVDGTTWVVAATAAIVASTRLDLDAPLRTRYVRCREVNGATPQTTNRLVSSLRT